MNTGFKVSMVAAGVALALAGSAGEASHFRGGVMIPSVNANGLLTVNATTFWRPTAPADIDEGGQVQVASVGGMTQQGAQVTNTSDVRFTRVESVHTVQLPGAGTFNISASSCCRVGGISNFAGSSSTSWTLNSQIVWNGTTATTPILFNMSSIQPEVVRGAAYNGSLGAVGGPGLTLTYDQVLNPVIASQPPGFTIDPNTGALSIPAGSTTLANYPDNPTANLGADVSFSGNIHANSGSTQVAQVEFEWLFDGVQQGTGNLAPQGNDVIINALLGSTVNHTFTASDDGNPIPPGSLTWSFIGFLGGAALAPTFDPATQAFSWDSTGSPAGQYVAQVLVSDGSLTDIVLATINLNGITPPPGRVPEPGTLSLLGLALAGLGFAARRKSRKS